KTSRNILFEGDGYSQSWEKEAAKRKLKNLKSTPEALKIELEPKFVSLFVENGVLSQVEIEARNEIKLEKYSTLIDIEAQVLVDLARNHIIPTAVNYQNKLIENVRGLKEIFSAEEFKSLAQEQIDLIKMISGKIAGIKVSVDRTISEMKKCQKILDTHKKAEAYSEKVKPYFDVIRADVDELEMLVDDEIWPLTKYRELLFSR